MRFKEFKIIEAPEDDLQKKYNSMLSSLAKSGNDEGFFGRNRRRQGNAEILAKFAADNNLPGMYDPETGNYIYNQENTDTGENEVKIASNSTMDSAKDLARKGLLPDVVKQRFIDQLDSATTGFSADLPIIGKVKTDIGKSPDLEKDMQEIFKLDGQAKARQKKSKVPTPNTQQFAAPAQDKVKPTPSKPTLGTTPDEIGPERGVMGKERKPVQAPVNTVSLSNKTASTSSLAKPAVAGARSKVSYNDLAKASGIADPNKIRPGQEIKLPGGGVYKVKQGDTLSGIANRYNKGSIGSTQTTAPAPAPAPAQTSAPPRPNVTARGGHAKRIQTQKQKAWDKQYGSGGTTAPAPAPKPNQAQKSSSTDNVVPSSNEKPKVPAPFPVPKPNQGQKSFVAPKSSSTDNVVPSSNEKPKAPAPKTKPAGQKASATKTFPYEV